MLTKVYVRRLHETFWIKLKHVNNIVCFPAFPLVEISWVHSHGIKIPGELSFF